MIIRLLKNFILCFLLFLCAQSKSQLSKDLLFDISVQSGASYIGITKIQFQYEGLLCRTYHSDSNKNKVTFIPAKRLSSDKILEIFDFIQNNSLMSREFNFEENEYYPADVKIKLFDVVNNRFILHRYNSYQNEFDKLIILMNELVPRKYRKKYQLKRIPKSNIE